MPVSPSVAEATTSVAGSADAISAESSTAEVVTNNTGSENKPLEMLDAVKAALAPKGSADSPEPVTQELKTDPKAGPEAKPEDVSDELTEDEQKQLSRKAQRRFRELSVGNKELGEKLKELEPKAKEFDRTNDLMVRNELSTTEVDNGFEIMALIKTQPEKALERLAPIVKSLLKATGHAELPDDLAEEVKLGAITEARARELSQTRAQATRLQGQNEANETKRAAEEKERQETAIRNTAISSAEAWNSEKAGSDPDWHLKQGRLTELVKLHVLETGKFPQSDKEARALFDEKLKIVETDLKRFIPKKAAIKPVAGDASSRSTPAPKTLLEAMQGAVAAA